MDNTPKSSFFQRDTPKPTTRRRIVDDEGRGWLHMYGDGIEKPRPGSHWWDAGSAQWQPILEKSDLDRPMVVGFLYALPLRMSQAKFKQQLDLLQEGCSRNIATEEKVQQFIYLVKKAKKWAEGHQYERGWKLISFKYDALDADCREEKKNPTTRISWDRSHGYRCTRIENVKTRTKKYNQAVIVWDATDGRRLPGKTYTSIFDGRLVKRKNDRVAGRYILHAAWNDWEERKKPTHARLQEPRPEGLDAVKCVVCGKRGVKINPEKCRKDECPLKDKDSRILELIKVARERKEGT